MSVFDPIITMVRPNRNISSDSSESWKATADEDVKDMKDKENSLNDNDERLYIELRYGSKARSPSNGDIVR